MSEQMEYFNNEYENAVKEVCEERTRYKQTIEEIKELAEKIDDSCGCIYGDYNCNNCSSIEQEDVCNYKVKKLIIQKLSEVE